MSVVIVVIRRMGLGLIGASQKAAVAAGWTIGSIDVWEFSEAFAAQSLAAIDALGLDPSRGNDNGGAIALGYPTSASGARVVATPPHAVHCRRIRVAALRTGRRITACFKGIW